MVSALSTHKGMRSLGCALSQERLLTDPRVIATFMCEPQLMASWQKQQDEKRYFRAQRHFLNEPIGIIPIEIFWQIFMHLASEWNDWAIVTQVCRYWRQAALAFPTLWTRITLPCNGAFFLLACTVPESRRLRVSVDLSESHWSDNQGFTRFQPLYSRIRAFDVVATTESYLSFWRHWKSAGIPLEYLHMKIFHQQTGNVDWILGLNHRAPSTLQTLRISHCMVAWRMIGEICGLSELILERPHRKPIGLPCLFELTCALRMHEKTLSRVVFENCAPEFASDGPRESLNKAPLELRELVLSGDLQTCTLFLQSIRLSPTTTVDLSRATSDAFHDANDRSNQEAITKCYFKIAQQLGGKDQACTQPIRILEVRREDKVIHFRAIIHVDTEDDNAPCAERTRIHFSVPSTTSSVSLTRACLGAIWDGLSRAGIHTVWVQGEKITCRAKGTVASVRR